MQSRPGPSWLVYVCVCACVCVPVLLTVRLSYWTVAAILDLVIEILGFRVCCHDFPLCCDLKPLAPFQEWSMTSTHTHVRTHTHTRARVKKPETRRYSQPGRSITAPPLSFLGSLLKAAAPKESS